MSNIKGRNWAFIIYPESMPSDWFDKLQMTGLPFAISPLHDKDLNPTGDEKKPHYHVLTYYDSPTTQNTVKKQVCDIVNGTIPIKLESLKGMYRYHVHRDNPEKYQYNDSDRTFINGFDVKRVADLSYYEIKALIRKIYSDIVANEIFEYSDLIDFYNDNCMYNELEVVENHTILFNTYVTSKRYKLDKELKKDVSSVLTTSHN